MTEATLTIGVVEDNDDLRESLVRVLRGAGYDVRGMASAEEFVESLPLLPYQVLLLDLNLPGEDGLSLATRLKRVNPQLRVVMMTTRIRLDQRVLGYESGADLYLPKPIEKKELLAALKSMTRQLLADRAAISGDDGEFLRLDLHSLILQGPNGTVELTDREGALLRALGNAREQLLEYWQLLQCLHLEADAAGRAALAVSVTRLRDKIQQVCRQEQVIRSLRSTGYQLCLPLKIGPVSLPTSREASQ